MGRLRSGRPATPLETVEQARAAEPDPAVDDLAARMRPRWFVGTGPEVLASLTALAQQHGLDEVMISPIAGSFESEPLDSSPGRIQTLEQLAA
jgi:hypothetical protein